MAEHDLPCLDAGPLFDVARQNGADSALVEAHVPVGVAVYACLRLEAVDDRGVRDDDEYVRVADRAMPLHGPDDLLARDLDLGNDDEVRSAGKTAVRSDPAGIAAHRFDHDGTVMRARGGAEPVEGVGDDGDRSVEPYAVVRFRKIVIHRFRHADHADAL